MPNIIEQQDLLKGLPDARLAMLLQNPVADIPPFLVAAEAQRRQTIRQQFAGSSPKESVVDTLTKQIANVPQNIQAPAQTPPNIPPTPQMQGVMALQQQQAAQQAAEQAAQPQQMRGGGMVQRYQTGGKVEPMWTLPDFSGAIPSVMDWVGGVADWATTPYSQMEAEDKLRAIEEEKRKEPFNAGMTAEDRRVIGAVQPKPKATEVPSAGKAEPTAKAEPETDEIRSRLEALYGSQEPSNWDKAQRWFAMAEQFLDPSKTTMQSISGAGQAFASAAAEQDRAAREMDLARQKALLEYDVGLAQERRAAEAEAAKVEREFAQKMKERGTPSADATITALNRSMMDIDDQIAKLREGLGPGLPPPPENQAEIDRLMKIRSGLNRQLISIMDRGGFVNRTLVTDADLAALGPL